MQVTDPVCAMTCDAETAVDTVVYRGKTYYFCALGCRQEFMRDPERYAGLEKSGLQSEMTG